MVDSDTRFVRTAPVAAPPAWGARAEYMRISRHAWTIIPVVGARLQRAVPAQDKWSTQGPCAPSTRVRFMGGGHGPE